MIILEQCTKTIGTALRKKNVLSSVSLQIPSHRAIALVGPLDTEKRALINLLAGISMPTTGRVIREANVSFPVGSLPGFSNDLTTRINVAHVARLYGADVRQTLEIVESVLRMGRLFDQPYRHFPKHLRRALAYVLAFALPFETYLLRDDRLRPPATAKKPGAHVAGDFRTAPYALFAQRLETAGMIIPTNDLAYAQAHCDLALFLDRGRLRVVENLPQAFQMLRRGSARSTKLRRLLG